MKVDLKELSIGEVGDLWLKVNFEDWQNEFFKSVTVYALEPNPVKTAKDGPAFTLWDAQADEPVESAYFRVIDLLDQRASFASATFFDGTISGEGRDSLEAELTVLEVKIAEIRALYR